MRCLVLLKKHLWDYDGTLYVYILQIRTIDHTVSSHNFDRTMKISVRILFQGFIISKIQDSQQGVVIKLVAGPGADNPFP
jgi:hypothetical protein